MMKINDKQVAVFTDIHWGHNKDNVEKLQITQDFVKFLIKDLTKRKIKTIFFLGDFFDNRTSLNIQTLNVAYNNLKILASKFNIYMIVGNHDLFLKNSRKIQSIKPFTEINGLNIISETTILDFNGKFATMCPWGDDITTIKDCDYLFGHFNMNGAQLCGSIYKNGVYDMKALTDIAPLVFSGHFHIRKEYATKTGTLITVGNPMQQDWGDYDNSKGFYVLDVLNGDYTFISNHHSPIHIKLLWSEIKDGLSKKHIKQIKNNYIKIVVDSEYKFQDILELQSKIKELSPRSCNIEYIFSVNQNLLGEVKISKKEISLNKIEYIEKFIKKMSEENKQDINWDSVIAKASEYHKLVG